MAYDEAQLGEKLAHKLEKWRQEDQADAITLTRHEIIILLAFITALGG
jgi:hypothetical protein